MRSPSQTREILADAPVTGANRANVVVTEEPRCEEVPLAALRDWITPTDRYFVRNHLPVPTIAQADWRLRLDGMFRQPLTLAYRDLVGLPERSIVVTTECAG